MPEPTYQALADELEGRIATMRAGARLPSEHELVATHGVSRLTARAALQELESRLLVRRVRGAGTFVARRLDYPIGPAMPPSSSEMIRRGGGRPTSQLVSVRTRRPPADVRRALDLDPDERVVTVTRKGQIDGLSAWYATSHLPLDLVEGLAGHLADDVSIVATLRAQFGMSPVRSWARAELVVVPPEVAPHLGVEGRPLAWRLESCNHDRALGRPVELTQSWMRGDVYRVRFELGEVKDTS
jgi:DNA-binding GntR family transcriptional regulator